MAIPAPPHFITSETGFETSTDAALVSWRHRAPVHSTELEICSSSSASESNRLAEKAEKNDHIYITENTCACLFTLVYFNPCFVTGPPGGLGGCLHRLI